MAIYELAYQLRMPVGRMLNEMTLEEYQGWCNYFERRPVGWRDDDRTYKLLQAQGVKEKAGALFPSLHAVYNGSQTQNEEGTNILSLKGSQLFMNMLQATGGDKLDL